MNEAVCAAADVLPSPQLQPRIFSHQIGSVGAAHSHPSSGAGLIEPEQLHGALRYLGWVFEAGFSDF